jgi:hypothetical protein
MGIGVGTAAVMEGIRASVAGLDELYLMDARLDAFSDGSVLAAVAARPDPAAVVGPAAADPVVDGPAVDDPAVDVLQRKLDQRLERLALTKCLEGQLAALKARDAADIIELQQALTPPDASLQDRSFQEMPMVEEIAGILTISSAAAAAFITASRQICSLPPAMAALSSAAMSGCTPGSSPTKPKASNPPAPQPWRRTSSTRRHPAR